MRNTLTIAALCCVILACSPGSAPAQIEITGVSWELSRLEGKNRGPYVPVSRLRASPDTRFSDHLRALVTLRNSAPRAAEGLVLRYALSLRLLKNGEPEEKAFWSVPFYVEEVRVSRVNPNSQRQAKVIRFELQNQLSRLRGSGFLPTAMKLEVMLNPRRGDSPSAIMREAVIEIDSP